MKEIYNRILIFTFKFFMDNQIREKIYIHFLFFICLYFFSQFSFPIKFQESNIVLGYLWFSKI